MPVRGSGKTSKTQVLVTTMRDRRSTSPTFHVSTPTSTLRSTSLITQVSVAAKLARRAIRGSQGVRPAWLLLSRCYMRQVLNAKAHTYTPLLDSTLRITIDTSPPSLRDCTVSR